MSTEPIPLSLEEEIRACTDATEIAKYAARSGEKYEYPPFARVLAAQNPAATGVVLDQFLTDARKGVVLAALWNPNLTKAQYDETFTQILLDGFCIMLTPALAENPLADNAQLALLLRRNKEHWHNECLELDVLNNYRGRDESEFVKLIAGLMPKTEEWRDWTEVEKRAYFRTTGRRRPPR